MNDIFANYRNLIPLSKQGNELMEFESRLFAFRRESAVTGFKDNNCCCCKIQSIYVGIDGIAHSLPLGASWKISRALHIFPFIVYN